MLDVEGLEWIEDGDIDLLLFLLEFDDTDLLYCLMILLFIFFLGVLFDNTGKE